jgi:predicted transcriptional regulator
MRKGNLVADDAEPVSLAEMTVEIVSAYVAHNQVAASDLPKVISTVAGGLRTLGRGPQTAMLNRPEPAVSVRRSVRPDHLVCLICGKKQKLIKRHLAVEHDLTPNQYRESFGLKPDYPMAAPNYAQQRRELAVKIGLGRPQKQRGGRRSTARAKAPKPSQSATTEAGS